MTSWRNVACCILLSAITAGTVVAQGFVEPKWPQQFALERGDHMAYGIAVGAPGAIVVSVNAKGAVVVAIVRPNGTVAKETQGAGSVRVDYVATPADIATGMGWRIGVRDAATKPMRGNRFDAAAAGVATSGTMAVEHPAGDPSKVVISADRAAPPPPPAPAQLDAVLAEILSTRDRARTDAQAQRTRVIQLKLSSAVGRADAQTLTARAPVRGAKGGTGISTTQSASTAAPVGTNQPQSIAATPVIASLDTAKGIPGDVVLITGSGFGPAPGGEVHFQVAANTDLLGTVTYWSDAQITVQVPKKEGVRAFAGQVYVRRGTNNSLLRPFRFEPETAYVALPITADRQVNGGTFVDGFYARHGGWPGIKGDDEYFLHTTLKNGWVLHEAHVVNRAGFSTVGPKLEHAKGDAYVSASTPGSDAPRIKVHWWAEADSFYGLYLFYWPVVIIRGPKGLPYE